MSDRRFCPRCAQHLPLVSFGFRDSARTKLQSYCRECQNAAWRKWYFEPANSARHRSLVAARRQARIDRHKEIVAARKAVPCADCGERYAPHVMDFDHVAQKRAEVSKLVYTEGTEALLREIEKCQVVCANCHRERTHRRGHGGGRQ